MTDNELSGKWGADPMGCRIYKDWCRTIGLSDTWGVKPIRCLNNRASDLRGVRLLEYRTNWVSNQWGVGIMWCRTTGLLDTWVLETMGFQTKGVSIYRADTHFFGTVSK